MKSIHLRIVNVFLSGHSSCTAMQSMYGYRFSTLVTSGGSIAKGTLAPWQARCHPLKTHQRCSTMQPLTFNHQSLASVSIVASGRVPLHATTVSASSSRHNILCNNLHPATSRFSELQHSIGASASVVPASKLKRRRLLSLAQYSSSCKQVASNAFFSSTWAVAEFLVVWRRAYVY